MRKEVKRGEEKASPKASPKIRISLLLFILTSGTAVSIALTLPQRYYPSTSRPVFTIATEYLSVSAETVDRKVSLPIAETLRRVRGIRSSFSTSSEGRSRVFVEASLLVPKEHILIKMREALSRLKDTLPSAVEGPTVFEGGEEHSPVWIAAFPESKKGHAHHCAERIRRLSSDLRVEAPQKRRRIVSFRYDTASAFSSGFTPLSTLSEVDTLFTPEFFGKGGDLIRYQRRPPLTGKSTVAASFASSSFFASPISEFSDIKIEQPRQRRFTRINSTPSVFVSVYNESGQSTVQLCRNLEKELSSFPEGTCILNRGETIGKLITDILLSIGIGIGLVSCILTLRTSFSATLPLLVTLPLSLSAAGCSLLLCNSSLNTMTMAGIAVGTGLSVDTSVIAYEVIRIHGLCSFRTHTAPAIFISSLTTVAVFFPLVLFSPLLKLQFYDLAVVTVPLIIVSTCYTLFILPLLLPMERDRFYQTFKLHTSIRRIFRLSAYARRHSFLLFILLFTGLTLVLCAAGLLRFSSFPPLPDPYLTLRYEFPPGTVAEAVDSSLRPVESFLEKKSRRVRLSARREKGTVTALVKGREEKELLLKKVRKRFSRVQSGGELFVLSEDRSNRAVTLHFFADDFSAARKKAVEASQEIESTFPEARVSFHFKQASTGYRITLDIRQFSSFSGLSQISNSNVSYKDSVTKAPGRQFPRRVAEDLFWTIAEAPFEKSLISGQTCEVYFEPSKSLVRSFRSPLSIILSSASPLPLESLSSSEERRIHKTLYRKGGVPAAGVSVRSSRLQASELRHRLSSLFPRAQVGEALIEEKNNKREIILYISAAVTVIALILYAHFGNLLPTLATILQIPLSYMLPFALLVLFNISLSVPVLTGFLLLGGVSVNNGVVLFGNLSFSFRKDEGPDSVYKSPVDRFAEKESALFLSTSTTAAGVLPIAFTGLSTTVLAPLSLVIASGTIASFLLLYAETGILLAYEDGHLAFGKYSGLP